ncbi:hypothetical protein EYF80_050810 [Liparis tanakae]|uniref:Uncharacterized protein n=1 Tax=Liparis tanakae TaxID=230148 RepID=A0A4Z2FCX3_9TELE|nr:hypothetical protein EYF80_050810 [Liparis tanakae]
MEPDSTLLLSDPSRHRELWKLPVMRLLSQVIKVGVGQLSALGGNLHGETSGDAVGALAVHQSESLEVSWRKD